MAIPTQSSDAERQWYIVGRWQEFDGESRANLLRIVAVGAFYIIQLLHFYVFASKSPDELLFHQRATAVAVAWVMVALGIMLSLRMHVFPAGLKYASALCDLVLLTALASLAAGPKSPLVLGYFVIIALAALRFSLGLLWLSTLLSMVGYWSLVGLFDREWFDSQHAVPPAVQLATLTSLALTGIVLGQVVRRVGTLAEEFARRTVKSLD